MAAENTERNRRRWERVRVDGDVQGRIHTVASAPVLDLSEQGALLEVSCSLRPGNVYALRLGLAPDRMLSVRCRVVRSYIHGFEPRTGGETAVRYRAAVEFVELADADRAVLRQRLGGESGTVEGVLEEEFE